jgi:putative zinc finger/helix-turn-helix YgiT family protein
MESPITGKEMVLKTEKRSLKFKNEEFEVVCQYYFYEESGEEFETEEMMDNSLNQVYNAYRVKHNLPFPEEIREIREKYGLTPSKMSKILGFGINQYNNYEKGEIPSKSNANLILLAKKATGFKTIVENSEGLKEEEKKKLLSKIEKLCSQEEAHFSFSIERMIFGGQPSPSILNGYKRPSAEKVFNVLAFFAEHLKPYKTKLNKLFFYLDFSHFRKYGHSLSGLEYRAIQIGPVPYRFDLIFQEAESNGYVERSINLMRDFVSEQFLPSVKNFNPEIFTEEEINSMKEVAERFKTTSTKDIIDLSHQEEAWIAEERQKNMINYNYSFFLKNI